ncbi:MAG TPA: sodium-translocating pyrophosphatase [Phycisphaerae bacterium]|nr:sodium-translocating pyrophosphatase [Phycisphaerae bacterium]
MKQSKRRRKIPTIGLVFFMLLCLGLYIHAGVYGAPKGLLAQQPTPASPAPAAKSAPAAQPTPMPAAKPGPSPAAKPAHGPAAQVAPAPGVQAAPAEHHFQAFAFMRSDRFAAYERVALWIVLIVAIGALVYAASLVAYVYRADTGTRRMKEIADAVREGANAYLKRQLSTVAVLIVILIVVLYVTKALQDHDWYSPFAFGRAGAFALGAIFSGMVGFVGMRLATTGNLRVAAAAPVGFGKALMLGYRTGTITGMLTDGLGLLGGTVIFMTFGERAYEALLGFGFGGTLLALFMRVGGGIYTKAADVGADLVGKVEKDIPEDDPRNAATIADNVGDNVGDCAGMAADIFESYEVTIVAAMILGWASFGHKGVIFPILVRAIGVIGSIISTYSVRAGDKGDVAQAMKSINKGFALGSAISVLGFIVLGYFYLRFDETMVLAGTLSQGAWDSIKALPWYFNWGHPGLDMRPAATCFVGILLCVALNRCTEYFTGTEYSPVRSIKKNTATGHATTIIEGFAVGYESAVWTAIILCVAIFFSVLIYTGTNAIFIAFGVAMCGIGMLTLTGNTISMDVFGPVADNANGIAEMAFDKKEMGEAKYKESRQILADLDAVGNTTKAVTKGVAIGSAVIAAVSLFASFITVIGSGGQSEDKPLPIGLFNHVASLLTVSNPKLLIGMLIGGSIPMLFGGMLIRAVGRAAYLIVNECRIQFRDKAIWEGKKKPNYARVVAICTAAAQHELIGPALLGVCAPIFVGFVLGPIGLAGFLGGAIVVGQLIASFMCNSGGAWDNAKKMVEDEPRDLERNTGKGSEKHKAAVTGDTVGDPLKDTAGPAVNPLLKVMNMVAILSVPLMVGYHASVVDAVKEGAKKFGFPLPLEFVSKPVDMVVIGAAVVSLLVILWAVWQSKRESPEMSAMHSELTD